MQYFHQLTVYEYVYQPIREADSVSEIKETRRFTPVIPCDMFPTPWLRSHGTLPRWKQESVSREEGPSPVGASGARGAGRPAAGAAGLGAQPPSLRAGREDGRGRTHRDTGRPGAGMHFSPAPETLHRSGEQFGVGFRTVSSPPPPDPLPGAF